MITSLLPPSQGRLLPSTKSSSRSPSRWEILLANLKVSTISWPLLILPNPDVPGWTGSPEPPWGSRADDPQPSPFLETGCCWWYVRVYSFHVPLLPSACLWKRKKERGGGENGYLHTKLAHIEASYQAWAGRYPALVPTPMPQTPRVYPVHLLLQSSAPHSGWQPGGQSAQHGRLNVLALWPLDNSLAQRLEIKGQ